MGKCHEVGRSAPLSRVVRDREFLTFGFAANLGVDFNGGEDPAARQGRLAPPRERFSVAPRIGRPERNLPTSLPVGASFLNGSKVG